MHRSHDPTAPGAAQGRGGTPAEPQRRQAASRDATGEDSRPGPGRTLAIGQGLYYVASGAWAIASLRSFEAVTGPKRDDWLVRTMGGLLAAIGVGLVARRNQPGSALPFGAGSSGVLLVADLIGRGSGRIHRVYLLDALVEAILLGGWLGSLVVRMRWERDVDRPAPHGPSR